MESVRNRTLDDFPSRSGAWQIERHLHKKSFMGMKNGRRAQMTAFERYMKTEHSGEQNAVVSKEIERRFNIKGSEVRALVNELRCQGVPICSNSKGYFYATNRDEVESTVNHLNSRIGKIVEARNGMKNILNQFTEDK